MTEEFIPDLKIFGVIPRDPGFIYVVQHNGRFKIGKTRNAKDRMKAAKTWLPDMQVIGIKPFWGVTEKERLLHVGFAQCWYHGEWFEPIDEGYRDTLIENFSAFSDSNRDMNSVNFIYWFNGDGLSEMVKEQNVQRLTIRRFQKQESEMSGMISIRSNKERKT